MSSESITKLLGVHVQMLQNLTAHDHPGRLTVSSDFPAFAGKHARCALFATALIVHALNASTTVHA